MRIFTNKPHRIAKKQKKILAWKGPLPESNVWKTCGMIDKEEKLSFKFSKKYIWILLQNVCLNDAVHI